jgi:L-seryl-tRNA(Ser) seleniumtransferase
MVIMVIERGKERGKPKMQGSGTPDVYRELGVKRVVNAMGHVTMLGGSILSPKVKAAMEEANGVFVSMGELLEGAGRAIADVLGAEAAFVAPGCFASLVLGASGIMTGTDRERISMLPDTTGMKNEFLIQIRMRYHYDRCVAVPGGRLKAVGDAHGTTVAQLAAALGPRTAGILYPAHMEGTEGTLSLDEVLTITRQKGVAVLVDAAWQVYPLERMTSLARKSDLACFSAKYMGGPQSAGFLCGRKALVEAAGLHGFIAYETEDNSCFGRGYKIDRQEVVATAVALREWFALDHGERLRIQEQRIGVIAEALKGLSHLRTEDVRQWSPWRHLRVILDEELGVTAAEVEEALRTGEPSIRVRLENNSLILSAHTLNEGEESMVAQRLREALLAS